MEKYSGICPKGYFFKSPARTMRGFFSDLHMRTWKDSYGGYPKTVPSLHELIKPPFKCPYQFNTPVASAEGKQITAMNLYIRLSLRILELCSDL